MKRDGRENDNLKKNDTLISLFGKKYLKYVIMMHVLIRIKWKLKENMRWASWVVDFCHFTPYSAKGKKPGKGQSVSEKESVVDGNKGGNTWLDTEQF